jgi:septum site-determining protein MinD
MDLKKGITDTQGDPEKERVLRQKTLQSITQIVDKEAPGSARDERSKIIKEVLEEALGLGPLEDLLADISVTEIMVNGHKRIFVEKSGKVQLSPVTFTSNMHLRNVIERIVTPLGRRIDEKTPYVDARLKDGSRVNAIIEPLSIDGPAVTIRKFKKGGITAERYIEFGSVTRPMIDFLKICVENGLNLVISGGTGSGKTSLLNMLSGFIPSNERIVTVEDAAELQLNQEHVVRLETRPANMEGTGTVSIRDLIKNSLRMRPDRIVVGECRDGAALDMLQAMNTGHDGSMTTTHANSARECIARLETLCMMAGMDLPIRAIREQVASAVNLIVQVSRLSDGSRKILSITEVVGMQGETVTLQEVFRFKETGYDKNRKIVGSFQALGLIPSFIEKLEAKGVVIPRDMFSNDPKAVQTGPAKAPTVIAAPQFPGKIAPPPKKPDSGGKAS